MRDECSTLKKTCKVMKTIALQITVSQPEILSLSTQIREALLFHFFMLPLLCLSVQMTQKIQQQRGLLTLFFAFKISPKLHRKPMQQQQDYREQVAAAILFSF